MAEKGAKGKNCVSEYKKCSSVPIAVERTKPENCQRKSFFIQKPPIPKRGYKIVFETGRRYDEREKTFSLFIKERTGSIYI